MKINVKIEYNKLSEYNRVVFTCLQIARDFYQSKRFFLTHERLEHENRQVIIPKLLLNDIPGFWKSIEELAREQYVLNIKDVAKKLKDDGIEIESLTEKELKDLKLQINGYLESAIGDIAILFPQIKGKQITIEIRPTKYGTSGSFERAEVTDKKVEIKVTHRVDADKSHLLEIILSSLIYPIKYERNKKLVKWQNEWEINESLVDFLLKFTFLSKYAENYVGTMDIVEHPEIYYLDLIENSKNIFAKLGYPIKAKVVFENEVIKINGEIPKKPFSDSEKKIVKHLVDKKGALITNDELQDILWQGNYDKYSLWALAKTMERIRRKIKLNGISSEIIQTIRGKGYLIYD